MQLVDVYVFNATGSGISGSGICLGPKNYLGRLYQVLPVCITVEGANILTRTMMIFGQGAVRCHPLVYQEMQALYEQDKDKALQQFDQLIFTHIGLMWRNKVSSFYMGLSNARFIKTPGDAQTAKYYRQIARLSAVFALLADYAIIILGGGLKRKERISGLFADALSNLYLCSTVLKHFQDQGCSEDDLPLVHWASQQTLYKAEQALLDLFPLLPLPIMARGLRVACFPIGGLRSVPNAKLTAQTAKILLNESAARDRLTQGIYINTIEDDATGRIELAFKAVLAAMPIENKIRQAQKTKQLPKGHGADVLEQAVTLQVISTDDLAIITEAERARRLAIMVDDFPTN